jgi:hypothetical protein
MSGEGPESIPTSADPRSKRATKKRALTPVSAQASSVEALFARPDQAVLEVPSSRPRTAALPPEIVTNVQGSSAGAGSGEFHVYKASRRREYERLRLMDEEVRTEKENEEFARMKEELVQRDEEKTRRNREKREKMKARKAKAKSGGGGGGGEKGKVANGQKPPKVVISKADDDKDVEARDAPPPATMDEPQGIVIQDD